MGEILCLNAGSSSLKFALFASEGSGEPQSLASGKIENIGIEPHLVAHDASGKTIAEQRWTKADKATHETLLADLLERIQKQVGKDLIGVGHRVVHGGMDFAAPVRIDDDVLARLDALCPLAPLHQPHNLSAIRAVRAVQPSLPQIACFDTGFHHEQPAVATRLALPRALDAEGVRRYGFHGISYEYIARQLGEIDPLVSGGRVIAAHLGNGASLCAMKDGRSIDTTMGFTALDGLVMGTRCGALDPGAVLYLFQEKGMSTNAVEHLLYNESGLLGVSGISSDMRALIESDDPHAKESVDLFVYHIARQTGALASSLGGLDAFVFTAGIGENAPEVRSLVAQRLSWLGVEIDEDANRRRAPVISTSSSRITVRVIPTDEERMIAIHTAELLAHAGTAS
ncbi:acetate/propionate family kinase [Sphingomonas oryzagri]